LDAVEQVLWNQRLDITTLGADAVLGNVHDAGVEAISPQHPNRLRRQRTISAVREAPDARLLKHLLLGETPGSVRLEYAAHNRRAFRIGHQALAHRARRVQVADRLSSLEESDEEVAAAWATELERRSRETAEGHVQTIGWETARTEILKELEQRRARRTSS
jgi:hypothetical protein